MQGRFRASDVLLATFELLSILLFAPLVALLRPALAAPSWRGPALIGVTYVLLCVAVVKIRRLRRAEGARAFRTGWLGLPGICFGFYVLYMAAEAGGFFNWVEEVDTSSMPWWIAFAALGAIGLAVAYLLVLAVGIEPTIGPGPRREVTRLLCLAVAQLMIVILAAHFELMGAGSEPEPTGFGGKVLIFLAVYLFFLLFMATPRLLLLAMEPTPVAVVAFLAGTGYYVWTTLAGTAF
jgi:hypothetical protein